MTTQRLSPLQLELLKVYSFQPSQEDLLSIKQMLATYFSDKLIAQIGNAVVEKEITEENLTEWLNENN
jgi:hypothetical protein